MAMAEALPGKVTDLVENLRIEAAIEAVMNFVRRLNRYVAETEPFKVIKTDRAAAGAAVYIALEGLRFALNMLWPIMPGKVESILAALGGQRVVSVLDDLKWGGLVAGSVLTLAEPPFPRHEMPEFTESPVVSESKVAAPPAVTEAKSAPQVAATEAASEFATFDDFLKIQLKVGTVLSAEPVSGSDKLLKLAVDLGEEKPRQIVAGIGLKFDVATLPGTQITVVANLKPRKVFGVLSEGMILAAEDEDGMSLVAAASRRKPGTRIG
jgi:methionyl-tRNA synthetase